MEIVTEFQGKFSYNAWANREAWKSIQGPGPSLRWLGHIIGVEWLWLARLKDGTPDIPVWPEWSVEECREGMVHLPRAWQEYLFGAPPGGMAETVSYVDVQGKSWTNRVEDVLAQALLHSAYHRGQIAADVRASGRDPALTDYMHFLRQS